MRINSLLIGILLFASANASALPLTLNLRLPSDGADGGTLAIRLVIPPQEIGLRYYDGLPILVVVPGGQGVGGLTGGMEYVELGFVVITFIFPGGTVGGFHSDGVFDYRGERCILALRDVLLFAGGRATDHLGYTITDIVPPPVLTEMVGMVGWSNGGPVSMATLATHAGDLDFVATYVGWENPTNGQTILVEAGGKFYDCDPNSDGDGNGIPNDDGKNPYITGYSPTSIAMDFDRLAYDPLYEWLLTDPAEQEPPVLQVGAVFLDGNGNGTLDTTGGDSECFDLNGNGRLDVGEDYRLRPTASYETGSLLLYHSVEVMNAATAQDLFGGTWPPELADAAACEEFWSWRDATRFYGTLAAALPDVRCLLVFNESDHVQAADEHPHIQQAYDGLQSGGVWCRLNPDEVYYRRFDSTPPHPPADNDANTPVSWPDMPGYHEPFGLDGDAATRAAVLEMADRAWTDDWSTNLAGLLVAVGDLHLNRRLELSIAPNPADAATLIR
jgi:hypothetical protein